MKMQQ